MLPVQPGIPAITPEQLKALVEGTRRAKRIRRCATVATFGGWTTGLFGGLTLLMIPLSFSASGLFIGVALAVAAFGEFHGARLVRRFDARGPGRLAMNQVVLGASLVVYSLWCMASLKSSAGILSSSGDPAIDAQAMDLIRPIMMLTYTCFAAVGVVGPGLTAMYYASRARIIREFKATTDASVVEALKAA